MQVLLLLWGLFSTALAGNKFEDKGNGCPEHWTDGSLVNMGCLLFNSSATYSWTEASFFCQDPKGGNSSLVEIETQQQMDYLLLMLNLLSDHEDPRTWWTSGTDLGREGNWYWSNSLQPVEEFIWHNATGEPDQGLSANCLSLYSTLDYEGATQPCSKLYSPICQKK